jgi:hypothetical protein
LQQGHIIAGFHLLAAATSTTVASKADSCVYWLPGPAQVFLCSRHQDDVDSALKGFKEQGYNVHGVVADVSQRQQREELVQQVRAVRCEPHQHRDLMQLLRSISSLLRTICAAGKTGVWEGSKVLLLLAGAALMLLTRRCHPDASLAQLINCIPIGGAL